MRTIVRRQWVIESPESFRLATEQEMKAGSYMLRKQQLAHRVIRLEAPTCNLHDECWLRDMGKPCVQHHPQPYEVTVWVVRNARTRSREWATRLAGQLVWTLLIFGELTQDIPLSPINSPFVHVPPLTTVSLDGHKLDLISDIGDEGYGRHSAQAQLPATAR